MVIESILFEYRRYKSLVERAIAQVEDADLYRVLGEDGNSIAILIQHLSGNLKSRFTHFLTEDGEKPWRHRDREFEETQQDRAELLLQWNAAWEIVLGEVGALTDADLSKTVHIRGVDLTVSDALHRSLAHAAYHVGQIVLLARVFVGPAWESLSIPRGKSEEYNQNPVYEKHAGSL